MRRLEIFRVMRVCMMKGDLVPTDGITYSSRHHAELALADLSLRYLRAYGRAPDLRVVSYPSNSSSLST